MNVPEVQPQSRESALARQHHLVTYVRDGGGGRCRWRPGWSEVYEGELEEGKTG
jgi:hypothetical protein